MNIKNLIQEMELKMYNDKNFIDAIILRNVDYKIIKLNDTKLQVFKNGFICRLFGKRWNKHYWKPVKNSGNNIEGYNQIRLNNKLYLRQRIMGYTFFNLDINDLTKYMDHKNNNRLHNDIENLRIVSCEQNQYNRYNTKGYTYIKKNDRYISNIRVNKKNYYLGCYKTPEEARQAYLQAKEKYHIY